MTPEDEAFEEIERRQGGFHAKRQAAMDKVNAEFDEEYIKYRTAFPKGYTTQQVLPKDYTTQQRVPLVDIEYTLSVAEPAQEPVAWITPDGEGFRIRFSPPTNEVPLGWDALYIAPPKRPWVGLTEENFSAINQSCFTKLQAATSAESILRERNT